MTALTCDPQTAAEFLRALAHPMRLQILCCLMDGEHAVAAFESELGLKQPNLSQQLAMLREAGLVTTRREAKSIFYSLTDDRVRAVLTALRAAFDGDPAAVRPPGPIRSAATPIAATLAAAAPPPVSAPQPAAAPSPTPALTLPRLVTPRAAPRQTTPAAIGQPGGECGVFSVAGWPDQAGDPS